MKHFNNRLKKFSLGITFLFAVFFTSLLIPLSSTAADSGTCGENIKWSLSSGVLELSGKGDMPAFSEDGLAPWYENRKNIRRVIIGDGITSIAPLSLYECENLHSLSLPATLTKIGDHAFYGCKRLVNVTIPSSVKIVEESAFRECEKLFYVSLPQGLEVLGDQAFYRCSTLSSVMIPSSVTDFGVSVFAYCDSLIRADIRAQIGAIPMWTFYGCHSLVEVALPETVTMVEELAFLRCENIKTVYYSGSVENLEKIAQGIEKDLPGFSVSAISSSEPAGNISATTLIEKDNKTHSQTVDFTQTEDVTIIKTETHIFEETEGSKIKIDASISNEGGWQEIVDIIKNEADINSEADFIEVEIRTNGIANIPGDTLKKLEGQNVRLTLSDNEYSVTINCEDIEGAEFSKNLDFSFMVVPNDSPTKTHIETIGDAESYLLSFNADSSVNFSPNVFLDKSASGKYATLYQRVPGKGLVELQTVLVDSNGYASFYLASVKKGTEYVIALNVAGVDTNNAIVPEDMALQNAIDRIEKIEYTVSGVRTVMGMTLGWFILAVIGGILLIAVVVAVIMFVFFKKKVSFNSSKKKI